MASDGWMAALLFCKASIVSLVFSITSLGMKKIKCISIIKDYFVKHASTFPTPDLVAYTV